MRKEESGVLPVWCPFYREDSGQGDWLGGEGANYLDMETGKVYPWLVNAWEELNIPWPLPGDNG